MTDKVDLVGIDTQYDCDVGGVFRKHTQVISDDFLTSLKEQRNASKDQREGEFMRVASIPVVVVEKWMREGFDIMSGKHYSRRDRETSQTGKPRRLPHNRRAFDGYHQEILEDGHQPENGTEEDRRVWREGLQDRPRNEARR